MKIKYKIASLIMAVVLFALLCIVTAHAEPANTYVYFSNYYSNSISVINPADNSKVTDIIVDSKPSDVIVNPAGTELYVAYDGGYYLDCYSTIDYSRLARITVSDTGLNIARLAMNDAGTYLYLADVSNGRVVKIDAASKAVVKVIDTVTAPYGIYCHDGSVYVSDYASPYALYKFDGDLETVSSLSAGLLSQPQDIAYDSKNNRLIVNNLNGTLAGVSVSTFTFSGLYKSGYATGTSTYGITTNNTGFVFVSYWAKGGVTVFNSSYQVITNLTFVSTGAVIKGILYNNYNNTLFVAGFNDNTVYIVNSVTGDIIVSGTIGNGPYRISIGTQATPATTMIEFRTVTAFKTLSVSDVNVTIYNSQNMLLYSGVTDDRGVVTFYMNPAVKYNILFNQSPNINQWYNVTPSKTSYLIDIPFEQVVGLSSWSDVILPDSGSSVARYTIDHPFNSSTGAGWMNATYSDESGLTTTAGFFLYKNGSNVGDTSVLVDSALDSSAPFMCNFSLPQASGNGYQIIIKANQTGGGQYSYSQGLGHTFPGAKWLGGILPLDWYFWIAFGIVLIFFSVGTISKKGLFGIFGAVAGWFFTMGGWFSLYLPDFVAMSACGLIFILSVLMYFVEREKYT